MCGVAGFIHPAFGEELLDQQLKAIFRRGPDGQGRFSQGPMHLGMRRLSIIDLEGGWQPLLGNSGLIVAFQNGEIYNYRELRAVLQARGFEFKTHSDTEVLAHGYHAWGIEGLLSRLDGMYAICIADLQSGMLHLARDRFGEKPLYYSYDDGRFAFASSLRSLVCAPWIKAKIDPAAVERYLATHFIPGSRTIFRDVHKLLPGERLEIPIDAKKAPALSRYYLAELSSPAPMTVGELEALLEDAVQSRLVADVPMGIFLSGGIDSSLITALAARSHPEIESFCMAFDDADADESAYAQAVADHVGVKLNTFNFTAANFMELLPKVCMALDEPIGDQALLPLYWLAHEASKKVKVVISGEGADEIFGGYSYYRDYAQDLSGKIDESYSAAHDDFGRSTGLLVEPLGQTQSGFPLLTYRHERDALVPMADGQPDAFERGLLRSLTKAHDPLQRKSYADTASWLPDDLLVKADRMTMDASIESRAPFLAPSLVERGLSLPQSQKFAGGVSKSLLRDLARKLLPATVVDRPKHGFVLPMRTWVDRWFKANGGFESYFANCGELAIDFKALTHLYNQPGRDDRERLWFALIVLTEWWKSYRD